jgi:hypothetical protein
MDRLEYWKETLSGLLAEHDVDLPAETVAAIADGLLLSASAESESTGWDCSDGSLSSEVDRLKRQLADTQREAKLNEQVYANYIKARMSPGEVFFGIQNGKVAFR